MRANLCRYFSGFAHWHPLLRDLDFAWRMEPDVHFYCDMTSYDPFVFMQARSSLCAARMLLITPAQPRSSTPCAQFPSQNLIALLLPRGYCT